MRKFLLYDYHGSQLTWSERLIIDEPIILNDYKNGFCKYIGAIFIENNVARISGPILYEEDNSMLDYASAIENKVRQYSQNLEMFLDDEQSKNLCNFFISKGWVVQNFNPDTVELCKKG